MDDQNQDQVLRQIGEEIRIARAAGNIEQAAHFAGVGRQLIDASAPPAPAIRPELSGGRNHDHVGD